MLSLEQIESFYPEYPRAFKKNLLREYLQHKILEVVFNSRFGKNLAFLGGTALRIIFSHDRFSEDLDFDNRGLNQGDFEKLTELIATNLFRSGYSVELKNVMGKVFRSYVKIADVLYENKISRHKNEKLLIQLDMEPQGFDYRPASRIINKFDLFLRVNYVPPEILLAQKIACLFLRPRPLGRDFYDVVFLLGRTTPNWKYLRLKLDIQGGEDLKRKILIRCGDLNLRDLARDIEPFLIDPAGGNKVSRFLEYIQGIDFNQ